MPSLPRLSKTSWFWIAIGGIIAVRIVAVAFYPATGFPDRFGYLAYAETILTGTEWLHQAYDGSPLPGTAFRAPGYPLILAGLQILFGQQGFALAVQILQCAATVLACLPLFDAARRLVGPAAAALTVLGFGLSVTVAYELSILPDAFLIAAWIALLSITAIHWLDRRPMKPAAALLLGLMAVYVVMARGNGLHLLLLTLPVVLLATCQPGQRRDRRAVSLLLVYLPGFLAYGAVSQWNEYRTGERFFTTGGQIAMVQPVIRMAELGASPFVGDDLLRRTIREHAPDLSYEQIYDVDRALSAEHGLTPNQIANANVRLYLDTVIAFPAAFARMWVSNFDDKFAIGLVNPAFGLHEAHRLVLGERAVPGFSAILKRGEGGVAAIPYAILYALGMLVSIVIFAAAALGTPIRFALAWRQGTLDRRAVLSAALWITCAAVIAYYCALFLVLRYVIMLSPFLIAIGVWTLTRPAKQSESAA